MASSCMEAIDDASLNSSLRLLFQISRSDAKRIGLAMQTLTTAQAVVSMLEVNGIDTIFCLPGVQNDPFFDALYDRTNAIRPIHARHEQACAYMALGYAMASGAPSAYVVVPGPGFLNTTAAMSGCCTSCPTSSRSCAASPSGPIASMRRPRRPAF